MPCVRRSSRDLLLHLRRVFFRCTFSLRVFRQHCYIDCSVAGSRARLEQPAISSIPFSRWLPSIIIDLLFSLFSTSDVFFVHFLLMRTLQMRTNILLHCISRLPDCVRCMCGFDGGAKIECKCTNHFEVNTFRPRPWHCTHSIETNAFDVLHSFALCAIRTYFSHSRWSSCRNVRQRWLWCAFFSFSSPWP